MSRVRPRDAAAEEQYDYSGQKRSASFDMGALLVTSPLPSIATYSSELVVVYSQHSALLLATKMEILNYCSLSEVCSVPQLLARFVISRFWNQLL